MSLFFQKFLFLLCSISLIHVTVEGFSYFFGNGTFDYSIRSFLIYVVISTVYGFWSIK